MKTNQIGSISWIDLTVPDADSLRDFYNQVTGWKPEPVGMGGYDDYTMAEPETGNPVAGICHARGVNTGLPAQWLMYVTVASIEQSTRRCKELGGQMVTPVKQMGSVGSYCVIRDPSGAVAALFEPTVAGEES